MKFTVPFGADPASRTDAVRIMDGEVIVVTEDGPEPALESLAVPTGGHVSTRAIFKCVSCGKRAGRIDEWSTSTGQRVVCYFGYWYPTDSDGNTSAVTMVALLEPASSAPVGAECAEHGPLQIDRDAARRHVLDSYSVQANPDGRRKVTRRVKLSPVGASRRTSS